MLLGVCLIKSKTIVMTGQRDIIKAYLNLATAVYLF